MTTDDVCLSLGIDEGTADVSRNESAMDLASMMRKRLQRNVTAAHRRHKQYPPSQSKPADRPDPAAVEDSHHAPATPDEYIIWRLNPLRDFYQARIPRVRRTRMAIQASLAAFLTV